MSSISLGAGVSAKPLERSQTCSGAGATESTASLRFCEPSGKDLADWPGPQSFVTPLPSPLGQKARPSFLGLIFFLSKTTIVFPLAPESSDSGKRAAS